MKKVIVFVIVAIGLITLVSFMLFHISPTIEKS